MGETVFPLKSKKMGGDIHYSTIYCAKTLLTFHSLLSGCKNKRKFPAADCCSFAMREFSSLGRYVFGSEISYNKAPPRLPGLGC
jgi:hypothetical protein